MKFRIILFLLAFIATMQTGLAFRTERIIRTVDEIKPVQKSEVSTNLRIEAPIEPVDVASDYIIRPLKETIAPEVIEIPEETEVEAEPESLGEFRVTAYCACEKCCGKWALNRPLDENGEPIVYGASGEKLVAGYSVASPLEFGTKIELDELGVVEVQDRTAQWVVDEFGIFIVDLYMTDHEEAWNFGEKYLEGFIR